MANGEDILLAGGAAAILAYFMYTSSQTVQYGSGNRIRQRQPSSGYTPQYGGYTYQPSYNPTYGPSPYTPSASGSHTPITYKPPTHHAHQAPPRTQTTPGAYIGRGNKPVSQGVYSATRKTKPSFVYSGYNPAAYLPSGASFTYSGPVTVQPQTPIVSSYTPPETIPVVQYAQPDNAQQTPVVYSAPVYSPPVYVAPQTPVVSNYTPPESVPLITYAAPYVAPTPVYVQQQAPVIYTPPIAVNIPQVNYTPAAYTAPSPAPSYTPSFAPVSVAPTGISPSSFTSYVSEFVPAFSYATGAASFADFFAAAYGAASSSGASSDFSEGSGFYGGGGSGKFHELDF